MRHQPQPATAATEEDFEHKHPAWFFTLILVGGVIIIALSVLFFRFGIGPTINQHGHELSHSTAASQQITASNISIIRYG